MNRRDKELKDMGNTKRVEGHGQYKRELKEMGNTKRVEGHGQYKES